MSITLKDIAQTIGISSYTASDILNAGDTSYSDKTQRKFREAARRMGYRPNRQARILRGTKSGLIGMLQFVNVIQSAAKRALFAGEAIYQAGYELLAYDIHWHYQGLERAADFMLDNRVESILLSGIGGADASMENTINRLKASGIPFVSMGGEITPGILHVAADIFQGGQLIGEHLLSLGYRDIAFLMSKKDSYDIHARRLAGVESVLHDAGASIEVVKGDMEALPEDAMFLKNFASGFSAFRELLGRGKKFDAVVCVNDYMALTVLRACHEAGIRDMPVIGFDDIASGQFSIPQLTTVAQPIREVATKAVEVLVQKINGIPHPDSKIIKLPCRLVVRESCRAEPSLSREPKRFSSKNKQQTEKMK